MQPLLIAVVAAHVLSATFWAGSTFVLARTGGLGAAQLRRPQIGAALVAMATGVGLWGLTHAGGFGRAEQVLTLGAAAALGAFAVQTLALARSPAAAGGEVAAPALAYRLSAGLLMTTLICMVAARYV